LNEHHASAWWRNTNQKAKSCFSSLQNYKETTQAEMLHIIYQFFPFLHHLLPLKRGWRANNIIINHESLVRDEMFIEKIFPLRC